MNRHHGGWRTNSEERAASHEFRYDFIPHPSRGEIMSDALVPEDEPGPDVAFAAEPASEIGPDVAFVVPAAVYDTIATDDELAPRPESRDEAPPVDTARVVESVRGLGDALGRKLDQLQTVFDREIRAEATREKVVDRLHAELQEYKQDLLLRTLRPMFVDLIQLHDDIGKMVAAQCEPDGEVARLLEMMRGFQQGIEDILYRQGVEPFSIDEEAFDPRRQRAVATVETSDPAQTKLVAGRLRKGFQAGERVIRPEIVSVYALKRS
jgi:molecular chaperone GrpE